MASAFQTPKLTTVKELADKQDRFGLFELLFEFTKPARRICDAQGLGPANAEKFPLTMKQWDELVNSCVLRHRDVKSNQCHGAIFHSFRRKHFYRRCDAMTSGTLCLSCEQASAEEREERENSFAGCSRLRNRKDCGADVVAEDLLRYNTLGEDRPRRAALMSLWPDAWKR